VIRFHPALEPLMVPAQSIHPHPQNANNGDVDEIVASVLTNGCFRPIYATREGTIVAGHHLYAALLELGAMMVPVIEVDVDASGARRILLADNRIAALARVDDGLLMDLLKEVADEDRGLTGTGYDDRYLDALRDRLRAEATGPLEFDLRGTEGLVHTITCPECGHSWVRSKVE
jgi:ParB-like chromosome segregation protein Spo0J